MIANPPAIYKQNTEPVKLQELLLKEFPKDQIKYRPGRSGKQITYVEIYSVIDRLNEAFNCKWCWELKSYDITDKQIYCLGRLTVRIDDELVIKETFGGKYNLNNSNVGDDLKAASSDALKKAASLLGIGLYFHKDEQEISPKQNNEKIKEYVNRW
ncbi:MAG: Rad52/Rad22 family DNA repair protein [Candidatus Eremiobacterota bacterium]